MAFFAQRKNILRPWFYRLLMDFVRFKKDAERLLASDQPQESVGDFFKRGNYSQQFVEQYFLPMGAAIWSSSFETFRDFPIQFIAEFYKNHGLLGIRDRPQWYDEAFIRRWHFYLCYCEAAFAERRVHCTHLMFAKPHSKLETGFHSGQSASEAKTFLPHFSGNTKGLQRYH